MKLSAKSLLNSALSMLFLGSILLAPTMAYSQDESSSDELVYTIVEKMPTYKGCESMKSEMEKQKCTNEKIMAYLSENVSYPEEAQDQEIEGRVFVRYIVTPSGKVTDVEVIRGIPSGEILDQEAVRVIQNLPDFNPGIQKGEAVAVQYNVPIRFALKENKNADDQ